MEQVKDGEGYLQIGESSGGENPDGEGYIQVISSGNQEFDSKTIGNNPYFPYLSIDTKSEHPEGKILIQDTDEIKSVLSQIQKIKQQQSVLDTINNAVDTAIKLIVK